MFIDLSSWAAYSFTKWSIRYRLSLEHRPTAKYDKTSTQFDAYTRSPKPRIKTQCTIWEMTLTSVGNGLPSEDHSRQRMLSAIRVKINASFSSLVAMHGSRRTAVLVSTIVIFLTIFIEYPFLHGPRSWSIRKISNQPQMCIDLLGSRNTN